VHLWQHAQYDLVYHDQTESSYENGATAQAKCRLRISRVQASSEFFAKLTLLVYLYTRDSMYPLPPLWKPGPQLWSLL